MSDVKCPFCNGELVGTIGHPICRNQNCVMCDDPMPQDLLEELIRIRKELEQSETCCTEWEKQALDYKAENIALSGDLERTRKALDGAINAIESAKDHNVVNCVTRGVSLSTDDVHITLYKALDEIKTALEQKD